MKIVIHNSGSNDITLVVYDLNNRNSEAFAGRLNHGAKADVSLVADGNQEGSIRVKIDNGPTNLYDRIEEGQTVRVN